MHSHTSLRMAGGERWQQPRKGSVRPVACAGALVTGDALLDSLGKGLSQVPDPILRSSMDDDDADVRFMTCGLLSHVFAALEGLR